MGAKSFDAPALLDFLRHCRCDYLYLAGDIIDGWKLRKRWHWPEEYNQVLDQILYMAANGTQIIYLPGNHEGILRRIPKPLHRLFTRRSGIRICERITHHCLDGRRLLVLHGDQLDHALLRGPLSRWGDYIYDRIVDLFQGRLDPHIKINGKRRPFSLAKALRWSGSRALNLIKNFERGILRLARKHQVDGIICGHTHIPAYKALGAASGDCCCLYVNTGAWLRGSHTALVEYPDGRMALIEHVARSRPDDQPELFSFYEHGNAGYNPWAQVCLHHDPVCMRARTVEIVRMIKMIWHPEIPDMHVPQRHKAGQERASGSARHPRRKLTHVRAQQITGNYPVFHTALS